MIDRNWVNDPAIATVTKKGDIVADRTSRGKQNQTDQSHHTDWEKLTWTDLSDWVGSKTLRRGETYQQQGRVENLCCSQGHILLAWVVGTEYYATRVDLDTTKRKRSDRISSECSCPVGYACKHGVAVVLEFLKMIEDGREAAVAQDDDSRWAIVEGRDDDEFEDDWDDDLDDWEESPRRGSSSSDRTDKKPSDKLKKVTNADIRAYLESKTQSELVDLLLQISGRDGDVRNAIADETALAAGRFDDLLREARVEMRSLTAEDAWWNPWNDEGHLPDYSGLEKRLRTLLAHGCADDIVTFGKELLQRGLQQIESSHDEGETGCQIADCMMVVRDALLQSSLSDEDKMLYALDVTLDDGFGYFAEFGDALDEHWGQSAWSGVADRLRERLDKLPKPSKGDSDWISTYRREQLSNWIISALDDAGRSDEATQLCVDEAHLACSHTRAVRRLLEEKKFEPAEQLAREGLEATPPKYGGIINELQDLLCQMAAKRKDWILPAAVAADRFFRRPSVEGYRELLKAAKKAKCESIVKQGALGFLETGQRPDTGKSKRRQSSAWPLPAPPAPQRDSSKTQLPTRRNTPYFEVLLELSIADKRPDDVLNWYDRQKAYYKNSPHSGWLSRASRFDAFVAEAVEETHPDRAITIYRELAESIANETNTKTYPDVGKYLKRIKPLLEKMGREGEWPILLQEFRDKHRRKRRLMQVLDGIDGRPIVKRKK